MGSRGGRVGRLGGFENGVGWRLGWVALSESFSNGFEGRESHSIFGLDARHADSDGRGCDDHSKRSEHHVLVSAYDQLFM
jgi:hypothetical protein